MTRPAFDYELSRVSNYQKFKVENQQKKSEKGLKFKNRRIWIKAGKNLKTEKTEKCLPVRGSNPIGASIFLVFLVF